MFTVRHRTLLSLPTPISYRGDPLSAPAHFLSWLHALQLCQMFSGFCPWIDTGRGVRATGNYFCYKLDIPPYVLLLSYENDCEELFYVIGG